MAYRCYVRIPGKRRRATRLYQVWDNMRSRTRGSGTYRPDLYDGLELGWQTFKDFRKWALGNGFSKETPSPDRIDVTRGYVPDNICFVAIHENRMRALSSQPGHDDVRGEETPDDYAPT